jgi:hypothetical protein
MAEVAEHDDWKPPFCANDADEVKCPKCGEDGCVRVREKETYFDGDCCEAYCAECHAELEVQVSVDVTFSDAEVCE